MLTKINPPLLVCYVDLFQNPYILNNVLTITILIL